MTAPSDDPARSAGTKEPLKPPAPTSPGDDAPVGTPGTGEGVCRVCGGTGRQGGAACANCSGTGRVNVAIGGA